MRTVEFHAKVILSLLVGIVLAVDLRAYPMNSWGSSTTSPGRWQYRSLSDGTEILGRYHSMPDNKYIFYPAVILEDFYMIPPMPTGDIIIPSMLVGVDKPVISIGAYAFDGCSGITSVTIPDSVTSIGGSAFRGCSGLTSVTIPDSVTSIGGSAFSGCSGLTSVTIPDSVTNIGNYAFCDCSGLTSVTIPDSVTYIAPSAFACCNNLMTFEVDEGNQNYSAKNGLLLNKNGSRICAIPYGLVNVTIPNSVKTIGEGVFTDNSNITNVIIPDSVISIGAYAFANCSSLASVAIPNSVTSIGESSFSDCDSLVSVTIPDSVISIGAYAFAYCSSLASVAIPNSVTSIGESSFLDCDSLVSVTIPDSVASVGEWAFADCNGLTSVTIGKNVTAIEYGVFADCSSLTNVILGKRVADIDDTAFANCNSLRSFVVDSGNAKYSSSDGLLLTKDGATIYLVPCDIENARIPDSVTKVHDEFSFCYNLMSISIGKGVREIDKDAFNGCSRLISISVDNGNPVFSSINGLLLSKDGSIVFRCVIDAETVSIPDRVTCIASHAFQGCGRLTNIAIPNSITTIGDFVFCNCYALKSVSIPGSVTNIYDTAFEGCYDLTSFIVDPQNENYSSKNGILLTKDETVICRVPMGLTEVRIPDDVASIVPNAFKSCTKLTSVTIPKGVTSIGDSAFCDCFNLKSMTIPNSVTSIGAKAFYGCSELASISMPVRFRSQFGDQLNGCSITYMASIRYDGDEPDVEPSYVPCGTAVGPLSTVDTPAGYSFAGWFTAKTGGTQVTAETIVEDDMTLYPQLRANEYNVTFDTAGGIIEGGSAEVPFVRTAMFDAEYGELPMVIRTGYSFDGWTLGDVVVTSNTVVKTAADHTLVAQWTANKYEVTFDAAGGVVDGGAMGSSRPTVFDSAYGELPTASCEGYVFLGWFLPETAGEDARPLAVNAETIVKTAENHTLTAKWGIQIGNGIWPATICDDPITLGDPLVPPTGDVVIPAAIAGRPVVGIEAAAFAGNDAITGITIPASVTNVAAGSFAGISCPFTVAVETLEGMSENEFGECLLTVVVSDDAQRIPEIVKANVRKVIFADGVTRIGDNWFGGAMGSSRPTEFPNLETFDIAESVVRIGTNVFEAASVLETVVSNGCVLYQGWCLRRVEDNAPYQTIPEGVRGIAAGAFEGEYGIDSVVFPSTLRFVGARAFKDCTGIGDIELPDGVVAVDREAFRNCTYAQSLSLPSILEEIGAGAFANCSMLMGVEIPHDVVDVGECAFSNCWRMLSAEISASVTNVGAGTFADCRRLTGVSVPFGVGTMAELFPAAYDKVTSVRIVADATERVPPMPEGMFAGCAMLESVVWPEGMGDVADGAFAGCASLSAFNLPDTVTNIGARAFADLSHLTAFASPAMLTRIEDEAFAGCSTLAEFSFSDCVETIGARAFKGCSELAAVPFSAGLIEIGDSAYDGAVRLVRVEIPSCVTAIGRTPFSGCTNVRAIALPGDVATVAEIFPDAYALITEATVTERRDGGVAPYQIMDSLFEGCEALAHVELPVSVSAIGARAFKGCAALTTAGIPSGVTVVGEEAFMGCANLSKVALPKGLAELSDRVFKGCSSLTEIVVPEDVTMLGASIFDGCTSLASVAYVGNAPVYNASAYAGVPAALITKVVNGSTGWDGIATSKALPEFWPSGTSNEITFWEPNRFDVAFVVEGVDGVSTSQVEQVTGTTYMLLPDAARRGAAFGGWWTMAEGGARVTASTQVALTRPHTFYAHWIFNHYSVHFDANGGDGEMSPQKMTVATRAALSECEFSRTGHAFVGWAIEPGGEAVYTDGEEVMDLAYAQGATVTLYAVWEARDWTLAEYVDAPSLALANDESVAWVPDWTVFKTGGVSLRSGELAAAEEEGGRVRTTLTATVVGEGSGSFWWKVSCEEMDEEFDEWYDYAVFTIDGEEIAKIAGERGWEQVAFAVVGAGTHTLAWTFTRDDYDEDETAYENVAWVDGIVWMPVPVTVTFASGGAAEGEVPEAVVKYVGYELKLPDAGTLANGEYQFMGWTDGENIYAAGATYVFASADVTLTAVWELKTWTLGEAVDADALTFTTGGTTDWSVDTTTGWTNGVSAKSGVVRSGESSWLETTVNGAGSLTFRWNVMGGIYRSNPFAYAKVELDGTQIAQEYATSGWKEQVVEIESTGSHTVRWTYLRTSTRTADGDCAWIDGVCWRPNAQSEPFPEVATNAAPQTVTAALAGAADARLAANVTDGTNYNAFCEWAARVKGASGSAAVGAQTVKESANVWLSYALGADRLITKEPTSEDVKIESFTPSSTDGKFEFTVSVKDVNIGGGSVAEAMLKENLKKVLGIEGATSLTPAVFSSDNINITFDTPVDGKAKFTVSPPNDVGNSFFMRVKVK